jgi:hypothetical protein
MQENSYWLHKLGESIPRPYLLQLNALTERRGGEIKLSDFLELFFVSRKCWGGRVMKLLTYCFKVCEENRFSLSNVQKLTTVFS